MAISKEKASELLGVKPRFKAGERKELQELANDWNRLYEYISAPERKENLDLITKVLWLEMQRKESRLTILKRLISHVMRLRKDQLIDMTMMALANGGAVMSKRGRPAGKKTAKRGRPPRKVVQDSVEQASM